MGVAPEVLEHLRGASEGALGVDDPGVLAQLGKERRSRTRFAERRGSARERKACAVQRFTERGEELPAKHRRERLHREQKPAPRPNPDTRIRERPAGDQRMHVQVLAERLAPGVKHQRGGELAAEPAGVVPELDERLGGRGKEHGVERARVALCERVQFVRQREDQVVVGHGQQFGASCREPALLGAGLALRAVPVAAGVINVAPRAAGIALAKLAPECGRAAALDRAQRPMLDSAKPMRRAKRGAVPTNDVGQFDLGTRRAPCGRYHAALPRRAVGSLEQLQR